MKAASIRMAFLAALAMAGTTNAQSLAVAVGGGVVADAVPAKTTITVATPLPAEPYVNPAQSIPLDPGCVSGRPASLDLNSQPMVAASIGTVGETVPPILALPTRESLLIGEQEMSEEVPPP